MTSSPTCYQVKRSQKASDQVNFYLINRLTECLIFLGLTIETSSQSKILSILNVHCIQSNKRLLKSTNGAAHLLDKKLDNLRLFQKLEKFSREQ
jgi:hypothetical protein